MEEHQFQYSSKTIQYVLEYKNVKNINISVKPDQTVYVSAPKDAVFERIESYLQNRAKWIIAQQTKFKATKKIDETVKEYVSGESIKYLGKQYLLKVIENHSTEYISIDDYHIILNTKKKNDTYRKQKLVNDWLRKEAYKNFNLAIKKIYLLVSNMIKNEPKFEVKKMAKRWGSCLRKKNLILINSELIKAPMHCIEYVVLHEMLHFEYKGHTKHFYDNLTVLMPDWKYRKEILDEEIVLFI